MEGEGDRGEGRWRDGEVVRGEMRGGEEERWRRGQLERWRGSDGGEKMER